MRTADELEYATMRWVAWYNSKRLHASLGYRTPQDVENEYYRQQAAQAVSQ
ncbi:integrase core domain-containing protein [Bifidobacterium sp. UTBIF-78]|uniref:integrase core domain-containing protein n=1 Tax=Bifidobacterium sp. UTBIF-78 TaxID=1465263 RepID=UPI002158FBB1|nr:integrase core domain-containing protein [Bifidobacterium sp. UTBIF-78]